MSKAQIGWSTFLILSLCTVLCLGCSSETPPATCSSYDVKVCTCPDGRTGTQSCSTDNLFWKACVCKKKKEYSQEQESTSKTEITPQEVSPQEEKNHEELPDSGTTPEENSFVEAEPTKEPVQPNTCTNGEQRPCFSKRHGCHQQKDGSYKCEGPCKTGTQTCQDGTWNDCKGDIGPSIEVNNGKDSNCDGHIDNVLTQVSAVKKHTCALQKGGMVSCWGNNEYGQLGNGNQITSILPIHVKSLSKVKQVVIGTSHSCALLMNGVVKCWGNNANGQVGGTESYYKTPTEVKNISNIIQISSKDEHTCALQKGGNVFCWGNNFYGQLGNGTNTGRRLSNPVEVKNLSKATQVSTGGRHTCVVLDSGKAQCWGWNEYGQLGNKSKYSQFSPTDVHGLSNVKRISGGGSHTCALLNDETVKCWGHGKSGELGEGVRFSRTVPIPVKNLTKVKKLTTGFWFNCALLQDETVTCWGNSSHGLYGPDTEKLPHQALPRKIAGLSGVKDISAGYRYVCVIFNDGKTQCWGENDYGQFGDGLTKHATTPQAIAGLQAVKQVGVGFAHICALLTDKTVKCWGVNDIGQLGNDNKKSSILPIAVKKLSKIKSLSVGGGHTCVLFDDETATCWGSNSRGQLGTGDTTSTSTPTKLKNLSKIKQIIARNAQTCVLLEDSKVRCWGHNNHGQLGDGKRVSSQQEPIVIKGLSNITQISLNSAHGCALRYNGDVWCWGQNRYSQLGDGTNSYDKIKTPVQVKNINNAKQISAASEHTCALLNDGNVKCWGFQYQGQLGDGVTSNTFQRVAKEIPGLSNVKQLSSGERFSCALKTNGSVFCWGNNYVGQLGNGALSMRAVPTQVKGLSDATSISSAFGTTCAVRSNKSVVCWGEKAGKLGFKPREPHTRTTVAH